ncbi:MAG: hypothetical protein EOO61_02380 [Hymenobacter sp.]|nr:MAG: hypothetical protein EOO61_02380 [Hymenobacter sp.]
MQIFLDCDGVLADFDKFASEILGMTLDEYEKAKHEPAGWDLLYAVEDYFYKLPKMPDADELVDGVRALGFEPIVLTGVPSKDGSEWAVPQKQRWVDKHFPGTSVICCKSKDKFRHMVPAMHNVLIDDWKRYKHVWEETGGTFILHKNAKLSLEQLEDLDFAMNLAGIY